MRERESMCVGRCVMCMHSKGICNGTQILICAVCNLTKDISFLYSNLFFFFSSRSYVLIPSSYVSFGDRTSE